MKSLLIILASITVTVISIKRLLVADSLAEFLFGGLIAVVFGLLSLYLIAGNKLKRFPVFNSLAMYFNENKQILQYLVIILGLLIMEVLFFSYTPESSAINALRKFLMIFFAIGIILLFIQIVRTRRRGS